MNKVKFATLLMTAAFMFGCTSTTQEQKDTPVEKPVEQKQPEEQPVVENTTKQYQVERGDSLWGISGRSEIYANPYQWPLIYKANSDRIKDADLIYPGQTFDINASPSEAEVSAAVNHAKTRGRWSLGVVEESDKAYLR
ncbi:MAG: LysM peptidoglycan-binding domain-containing protein [Gammaproteobacteria bacterium]|nr:LysM peptidoglycan-binding domain-containing protein [Gammaproteobacteria bacterium]MDH5650969.1 LysM peptidoglycan-binding domain-containing protein [Gammaproteobacteria bacterium]